MLSDTQSKIEKLTEMHKGSVLDLIETKFKDLSAKKVSATFTLNQASQQIFGLMHGGIYAYVAESLSSLGGWLSMDLDRRQCVGIEINANHLKAVSEKGAVIEATAIALRQGKTVQVWQTEFRDSLGDLVSIARCTLLTREQKNLSKA